VKEIDSFLLDDFESIHNRRVLLNNRFVGEIKLIKYLYEARKKTQNLHSELNTTLSKSGFTAVINHKGAELISLKDDRGTEYIWDGNPEFWGKHSPVLFPIVGTLKNNTYRYNNQDYQLSRHGFARDMDFEIANRNDHEVTFSLQSTVETLKAYPFAFELQIIYTLTENGLVIGYRVWNKNEMPMPFSIGAHPAFALSGNFDNYALEFEKNETLQYHLLQNDLISHQTVLLGLTQGKLRLDYKLFENDALVFKKLKSQSLTLTKNDKPVLTVDFEGFPNLGIWTKPGAPFLCIEPWFGYADTLQSTGNLFEKEAIQILEPHGNFETKFRILMR
jgi:galactose mutarotase-like enzyme